MFVDALQRGKQPPERALTVAVSVPSLSDLKRH
jgi:hypothetical protein